MFTTIPDRRRNRSRRRPPLPAVMEVLEGRLLLSVTPVDVPFLEGALAEAPAAAEIHKLMVAGDPNGSPADSPANRVDLNTMTSLYGGVGSLRVDARLFDGDTYIGSATAISPTHVLTAAHMFDLDDDGDIDVAPLDVTFNLNYGGNLTSTITAIALHIHPDFTGFNNPSINDDVAVVELSSALPAGVPIYALNTDPFVNIETVTLVGYGLTGDGVNGYDYDLGTSWSVKRAGSNRAEVYISDDEGSGSREGWELDFDGPSKTTNLFGPPKGSNLTLGNDIETTLGGGDSGGPAFIDDGFGGLEIFGINTFGFGSKAPAPLFGSGAGGITVTAYAEWIESVVGDVPPPPPTPGISVSPTSGLVTSEDGTTATFDVVLDTQPDAETDVTISLTSSNTTEGIIDKASLTFTSSNWNAAQTVTVTGVDDADMDGDQAYTIVTAAAISDDGNYDGLDAADVSVTNLDDEAPAETLVITKATFNSKKKELKIEATSSLGAGAGLEATYTVGTESARVPMDYSSRTGKWSVTFKGLGAKPDKVTVYSASGASVAKSDIGGKSSPVATAYAMPTADTAPQAVATAYAMPTADTAPQAVAAAYVMPTADTAPQAVADSPVLLPWAVSTPAPADAPQPADVSTPPTVADLPPLAAYVTITGSQQSAPPELVGLAPGTFEGAPADNELATETDLDLQLDGELLDELLDELVLPL